MGLELVRFTEEATYGVFNTSPAAGKQQTIVLPVGDAMTVRSMCEFWEIRDAGTGNRLIRRNVGRRNVQGAITTYLFPAQTVFLLGLATRLVGTPPCLALPSFSIDHMTYLDDSCLKIGKRYVGCRFGQSSIMCSASGQGVLTTFKGSIVGQLATDITITDFPNPSLSVYPAGDPYLFFHTAENSGQLVIDTARHEYTDLNIAFNNNIKGFSGERRYFSRVGYLGRTVSLSTTVLQESNDDRAAYEAGEKKTLSVKFDDGEDNTLLIDFGTNVSLDSVSDKRPLDDFFMQDLNFTALVDPTITVPTDLTITTTAPTP